MKVAMVAAEFTDDEANGLRRAMATFRHDGTIHTFEDEMVERHGARAAMIPASRSAASSRSRASASYGFPESHAAAFARLVYVSPGSSATIRRPSPARSAQLPAHGLLCAGPDRARRARARRRGARRRREAQPSGTTRWRTDDGGPGAAPRLAPDRRLPRGLGRAPLALRGEGYGDVEALCAGAPACPRRALRQLADADAFRSHGARPARGAVGGAPPARRRCPCRCSPPPARRNWARSRTPALPAMPLREHVVADYQTTRLSLKAHPMAFLRDLFAREGVIDLRRGGARSRTAPGCRVAGVVLVRQRPGKGNAIFMTLEDETGITNALIWARRFERFRREVMGARLALLEGRLQKKQGRRRSPDRRRGPRPNGRAVAPVRRPLRPPRPVARRRESSAPSTPETAAPPAPPATPATCGSCRNPGIFIEVRGESWRAGEDEAGRPYVIVCSVISK